MKKHKVTQIIRHIIQLLAFFIIPGLFIIVLSSISGSYKAIINGTFSLETQGGSLLTLLAVIPVTVLWGRFFCGYLCAFGSMQELLGSIAKRLRIRQINISPKADRMLKKIKYVVLLVLVIMWTVNITLDKADPWNVFGIYSSYKGWADLSYWISIGGALLILIMAGSLFIERFFCRYLCPLGGIFSVISLPRLFKVKKRHKVCVHCGVCTGKCPMGIDVDDEGERSGRVISGECIDCFKCSETCPVSALSTNPKAAVSGTAAAMVISGVFFAGTISMEGLSQNNESVSTETVSSGEQASGTFIDGTYHGSGAGYRGNTEVTVTVENGYISVITVDSYDDDRRFFNRAEETIISSIINEQSTDVAAVSGATYSSNGIIMAVEDALGLNSVNGEDTH